eukprot:GEZU01020781.1.p1 GENE.GEZU01020781.1~~GEZU01020781.1.p1  ORF type:complete len:127 (-),score=19.55 GEZU01020781.1:3-383(-)
MLTRQIYFTTLRLQAHEWNTHGRCVVPTLFDSQHSYFQSILELGRKLDVMDALRHANIVPSNSTLYFVEEIRNAVKADYGGTPLISCSTRKGGIEQINEVWQCISKENLMVITSLASIQKWWWWWW